MNICCCFGILFLFVTGLYVFYDYCVERRQKVVLQLAQQSIKPVNTLFLKNISDEFLCEQQEKAEL